MSSTYHYNNDRFKSSDANKRCMRIDSSCSFTNNEIRVTCSRDCSPIKSSVLDTINEDISLPGATSSRKLPTRQHIISRIPLLPPPTSVNTSVIRPNFSPNKSPLISVSVSSPNRMPGTMQPPIEVNNLNHNSNYNVSSSKITIENLRAQPPATTRSALEVSMDESVGQRARVAALATEVSDLTRRQTQLSSRLQAKEKEVDELRIHATKTKETATQRERLLKEELSSVGAELAKLRTSNSRIMADMEPLIEDLELMRSKNCTYEHELSLLEESSLNNSKMALEREQNLSARILSLEDALEKECIRARQASQASTTEIAQERESLWRKEKNFQSELQNVEKEVAALRKSFAEKSRTLENQKDQLSAETVVLKNQVTSKQEEIKGLKTSHLNLEQQIRDLTRTCQEKISDLNARESSVVDRLSVVTRELEEAHGDIGVEKAKRQVTEKQLFEAKADLDSQASDFKRAIAEWASERQRLLEEIKVTVESKVHTEKLLSSAESRASLAESSLTRLQSSEQQLQELLAGERHQRRHLEVTLESERSKCSSLETHKNRLSETEEQLTKVLDEERNNFKRISQELDAESRRVSDFEARLQSELQIKTQLTQNLKEMTDNLMHAQRQATDLDRELRQAKEESARCGAQLVHTRSTLHETEAALKQERQRADSALSKAGEWEQDVVLIEDRLQAATSAFESASNTLKKELETASIKVIQLNEETTHQKDIIRKIQGEYRASELKLHEYQSTIKEATEQSERFYRESGDLKEILQKKSIEVASLLDELNSERQERHETALELRRLKGEMEVLSSELKTSQDAHVVAKRGLAKLTNTYEELEAHARRLQEDAQSYERAESELRHLRLEFMNLKKILASKDDDLHDADVHVREMRKMLGGFFTTDQNNELSHAVVPESKMSPDQDVPYQQSHIPKSDFRTVSSAIINNNLFMNSGMRSPAATNHYRPMTAKSDLNNYGSPGHLELGGEDQFIVKVAMA